MVTAHAVTADFFKNQNMEKQSVQEKKIKTTKADKEQNKVTSEMDDKEEDNRKRRRLIPSVE